MHNENYKQSALSEVASLKNLIEEAEVALRAQRDVLKARGFNLPPMAVQAISALQGEMVSLEADIAQDYTELGQLRFLADTSARINATFNLDQVLIQSMDIVINLTGAERGFIILKNPETGVLDFRVVQENNITKTFYPNQLEAEQTPKISTTIVQEVLQNGEALLADNAFKDDRFTAGQSIAQMTLRSVLCAPLRYRDNVVGVVYVDNRLRTGVFTAREKMLLVAFANQISVAIQNSRLFGRIQTALSQINEMRQLMDNVFESISSGVITTDSQATIMLMNTAASQILMVERESAIGQPLQSILALGNELGTQMNNALKTRTVQSLEVAVNIQGRGERILNIRINPLKSTGENSGGVALVVDDLTTSRNRDEMINLTKRYLPPKMVENIDTISQLALGGERREVTCMYVDVRAIHSFPDNLRPQQVVEYVNAYLACATTAIHQFEGVVDKYMGTIIMVLFNTQLNPMEHDHAIVAVQAALALRDAFTEFYAETGIHPDPHYYRIGLNTGIATLGNVGSFNRREFTAIGDTINLAKRVEENTRLGQITISDNTYQHIHQYSKSFIGDIRFVACEPVQMKGRQQLTHLYEVFRA